MIKDAFLWLWQLPQNLLGLAVVKVTRATPHYAGAWYETDKFAPWGVSLGNYIIFSVRGGKLPALKSFNHECGHKKQSLFLGWLYLPLIGLPSFCGNILHRFIDFDYYRQPWERWADALGGVER